MAKVILVVLLETGSSLVKEIQHVGSPDQQTKHKQLARDRQVMDEAIDVLKEIRDVVWKEGAIH